VRVVRAVQVCPEPCHNNSKITVLLLCAAVVMVLQLLLAFKSIPDAIQSCWFMLHDNDETGVCITMRAEGTYMVYGGADFRRRRGSSGGSSSSSSSGGCAAAAGHPRKATMQGGSGRQLSDPATGNSSAGSSTDDDSSNSSSGVHCGRGAASPRVKSKRRRARLHLDQPLSLRHQFAYHSSDDDAALSSADSAVLDAETAADDTSYLLEKFVKMTSLQKESGEMRGGNLSGYAEDGQALVRDWHQAQREQQQCQQRCRQLLRDKPSARKWLEGCQRAVRNYPAPARSVDSCSRGIGSDDGISDDSSSSTSSVRFRSSAPGALRAYGQLQDPLLSRRQQQLLNRCAADYKWGGSRPWRAERARVLVQRQQVLNRVSALQEACTAELTLLQALQQELQGGAAARSCNGSSQQQQSQQEAAGSPPGQGQSACQLVINAAAALIAAGTVSALRAGRHTAALAAATGPDSPCLLNVGPRRTAPAGSPWHVAGALGCLNHLSVRADVVAGGAREALQEVKTVALLCQQAQQHLQGLCQPGSTLAVQLLLGDGAQQHTPTEGGSTRQLLWEVLQQLKPAACQWYEHGAQHYQQQKLGKSAAASTASSTADVSVPECCSVELWSTLCHSIAADLLLVPPGIRDMVGNGWAAGAGRLADMGADITSSSSSSVAGVAARMLVVQYARAARQKYAQVSLVGQQCCAPNKRASAFAEQFAASSQCSGTCFPKQLCYL